MQHRIRTIMESTGLTQQQFADRISISPSTLSNIFNGKTQPTNKLFSAVHNTFPEINVNWLLFGEGEMYLSSPAMASVVGGPGVPFPTDPDPAPVSPSNVEPDLFATIPDEELTPMVSPMSSSSSVTNPRASEMSGMLHAGMSSTQVVGVGSADYGRSSKVQQSAAVGQRPSSNPASSTHQRQARRQQPEPNPSVLSFGAKNIDKNERAIKEIRVFFSDGTYESFVPSK